MGGEIFSRNRFPLARIMLEITAVALTVQSKSAYRDEKF